MITGEHIKLLKKNTNNRKGMTEMNWAHMTKKEIIWAATHRCKHGILYTAHPHCYDVEHRADERIGFLDIESSNLKADFGVVICYCIADLASDDIISRVVTKKELFSTKHDPDYSLMKQCVVDMMKFDRLIGYYSGDYRFDFPFLRSRAVSQKIDFPSYGSIIFEDVYNTVKAKFALSSSRLENASRVLTGETNKTHWMAKHWIRALQGKADSLKYIVDHCKKDVIDLKRLYITTYSFTKHTKRSV
jgi:uncharacterized protein YprB with RNaseH-like and TPR domain